MMDAIRIQGLSKRYKDTLAVDNLSLTVREGELVSLLGVNGAGKTTTVKMLTCLTAPTSGEAYVLGKSIAEDAMDVKRVIAVSPQETAVAGGLTVKENLELMVGAHGLGRELGRERIAEISERLSLGNVMNKRAARLSGGWQRRLSIAMALISHPRVLFLDEPTLGLDVLARAELWDVVRSLRGDVTVVLTTHYMEEAEALSDRVAIMCRGRLLAFDTVRSIKEKEGAASLEEAFISVVRRAER